MPWHVYFFMISESRIVFNGMKCKTSHWGVTLKIISLEINEGGVGLQNGKMNMCEVIESNSIHLFRFYAPNIIFGGVPEYYLDVSYNS